MIMELIIIILVLCVYIGFMQYKLIKSIDELNYYKYKKPYDELD